MSQSSFNYQTTHMCTDYRTWSLLSRVVKVPLRIVIQRNRNMIGDEISETQRGFLPEEVTRQGIFNMRTICESSNDVQK